MSTSRLILGDCLSVLPTLEPGSVDCVVTDPPYGLGFMGKDWDHGVPGVPFWQAALRTLRPGGYLLAFGGTRTYHRLACAVEDAGWHIKDCLMWIHSQGFPKGHGCLKPAYEPVLLARTPGPKVLPLGIDECRIPGVPPSVPQPQFNSPTGRTYGMKTGQGRNGKMSQALGRWPANVVHDGSEEVMEAFAAFGETNSGAGVRHGGGSRGMGSGALYAQDAYTSAMKRTDSVRKDDSGTVARFFYCSKASKEEKGDGNLHPTVKPLSLMLWLVKLVCPAGGVCLDPFMGSGTTGVACQALGRSFVGIEMDEQYHAIAQRRLSEAQGPLFAGTATNGSDSHPPSAPSQGSLFPEGE